MKCGVEQVICRLLEGRQCQYGLLHLLNAESRHSENLSLESIVHHSPQLQRHAICQQHLMTNVDGQTITAISTSHSPSPPSRVRHLLNQHAARRLDAQHRKDLHHMIRHCLRVVHAHRSHHRQQSRSINQQVHVHRRLLHLVQHCAVHRRNTVHDHPGQHFLQPLQREVLIIPAVTCGYTSPLRVTLTLGSRDGGRRRGDAQACLPRGDDILILDLQLQLRVDDRPAHRLRGDLQLTPQRLAHRQVQLLDGLLVQLDLQEAGLRRVHLLDVLGDLAQQRALQPPLADSR